MTVTGTDVDDDAVARGEPVGLTDVHLDETFADERSHALILRFRAGP